MTAYKTSFRFDSVVVIDSLPSQDTQTGEWLRDSILAPLATSFGVKTNYCRISKSSDLWTLLAEIESRVRDSGISPILHFETHGAENGLILSSRELIQWKDLKPALTRINYASRMNLVAVMSMCHGWHLVSQLQPVEVAPVWALIGPRNEIFPARLQEAFQVFYPELLRSRDGRAAIEAMNTNRKGTKGELFIETAELTFCKIWRIYETDKCGPEEIKRRTDPIVEDIMRRSGYDIRYAIRGRALANEYLTDQEKRFAEMRASFLMLDQFPENEQRFTLTYRECIGSPAIPNLDQ